MSHHKAALRALTEIAEEDGVRAIYDFYNNTKNSGLKLAAIEALENIEKEGSAKAEQYLRIISSSFAFEIEVDSLSAEPGSDGEDSIFQLFKDQPPEER